MMRCAWEMYAWNLIARLPSSIDRPTAQERGRKVGQSCRCGFAEHRHSGMSAIVLMVASDSIG